MICTGKYGYLLANGDKRLCFPVIWYTPEGTRREQKWAKGHGMQPLGVYKAVAIPPKLAMYVRDLHWFDRNKKFLESWQVERFYTPATKSFTFFMKVDGVARWYSTV